MMTELDELLDVNDDSILVVESIPVEYLSLEWEDMDDD